MAPPMAWGLIQSVQSIQKTGESWIGRIQEDAAEDVLSRYDCGPPMKERIVGGVANR
jgi:hypothetical protein